MTKKAKAEEIKKHKDKTGDKRMLAAVFRIFLEI